jgi:predicted ATPase/DNA-binding winged helix-turn-helix (wHTH) protein/Flp pilus assembly protein TadD
MPSTEYRFGTFRLLLAHRQLLDADAPVKLGARAFDMLLALVEQHDRAISKRELMDRVWPNLVVEENNPQVQIVALRKVLGPAAIATIPGRGYRFTLAIDVVEPAPATPRAEPAAGHSQRQARRKTNLPEHLDPLYGRDKDIAAVRALLEQHALVSIVGAGGIGKTRLAQSVAHALRDGFADGVWSVDLAPLSDPGLVVAEVARALGVQVSETRSALDFAVQALAGQSLLLVLDNCEHLLEAVDHVVAALRKGAPDVRILATSQEVLRHSDEHVYRLGTLALPAQAIVSSALEAGAVELLVARAQAVEPRFLLSDENVDAVVEICRRLDGIPLAIELAAARVSLLGVGGVRERLDERFRLLMASSRLALRRHQTLHAALEWSYNLLSAPEQAVLDKLGIFAGSFSLECAQKLAADEWMDEWAVLDHLGVLVDKSLVSVDPGSTPRYRMLETTRAFALERLATRGATSPMMRRHAEVMLDLFGRYFDEVLQGTPSAKVTEKLAPDLDNLRGSLQWAGEAGGDRRIAIALFGAAVAGHGYFFYAPLKARHWIEMLRPLVDASIPAADAARFWLACADWGSVHSPVAAIDDARRAIALYREIDDRLGSCRAWNVLTYSLMMTGQLDEARSALDETLRLCDPAWPPWLQALVDNLASLVFSYRGELSEARRHALAFLAASRQASVDVDECTALSILIEVDVATGNVREAAATASELLARHPAIWEKTEDGRNLRTAATALMSVDRLDEAEPLYREALSRVRRNYGSGALVLYDIAMFLALRSRVDDAARVFAYVEHIHAAQKVRPRFVARQLRERLHTLLAAERPRDALSHLYDEGRRLTDDEACALAFPPLAPRS